LDRPDAGLGVIVSCAGFGTIEAIMSEPVIVADVIVKQHAPEKARGVQLRYCS
jgi:hypothetical protein